MDVKSMGKGQRRTILYMRFNLCAIQRRLVFIRGQDHHDVCPADRVLYAFDSQTGCLCLGCGSGALPETDTHLHSGITQVIGMGMTLGPISYNGDLLAFYHG
jgi:hypothetical protein